MVTLAPRFSAERMLRDCVAQLHTDGARSG
jgi:hypothetical protein